MSLLETIEGNKKDIEQIQKEYLKLFRENQDLKNRIDKNIPDDLINKIKIKEYLNSKTLIKIENQTGINRTRVFRIKKNIDGMKLCELEIILKEIKK